MSAVRYSTPMSRPAATSSTPPTCTWAARASGSWAGWSRPFADLRGVAPVAAMQLESSLVQRSIEREHLPLAFAHEIGVTAWSPLAGGILSGKYAGVGMAGPARMDSMQLQPLDDRNRAIATA